MALVTLDDDVVPLYWAGWERLAACLGRIVPDDPSRDDTSDDAAAARRSRRAAEKAVEDAVRTLRRAGAVAVVRAAGNHRAAEYSLDL
jgi:hypothetical protein